jgi:hypothetical protein
MLISSSNSWVTRSVPCSSTLQLPPRALHWSWAHERVEVRQHLDGSHRSGGASQPRLRP